MAEEVEGDSQGASFNEKLPYASLLEGMERGTVADFRAHSRHKNTVLISHFLIFPSCHSMMSH